MLFQRILYCRVKANTEQSVIRYYYDSLITSILTNITYLIPCLKTLKYGRFWQWDSMNDHPGQFSDNFT